MNEQEMRAELDKLRAEVNELRAENEALVHSAQCAYNDFHRVGVVLEHHLDGKTNQIDMVEVRRKCREAAKVSVECDLLKVKNERLTERLNLAIAWIERTEWPWNEVITQHVCSWCCRTRANGHADNCRYTLLMAKLKGE